VTRLSVPYLAGARLLWTAPFESLRVGGSVQILRLESDLLVSAPMMMPTTVEIAIPAVLWLASAEYLDEELLIAVEYGRWHVESESSEPMLFPATDVVSERLYAMVGYRVTSWFQPGLYYALLFPNVDDRSGREQQQHDIAATARFDLNRHWLLKLEAHFMHGTAGLNRALNDNTPLNELVENWLVLLAKSTVYF
jgi:hypothetical protein